MGAVGLTRRFTRWRNARAIAALRKIWRSTQPSNRQYFVGLRAPSALDLFLRELRSHGLTDVSDAAVTTDLLVLAKAFREAGGLWPGTGIVPAREELEELSHFAPFAMASYGSLLISMYGRDFRVLWRWMLPRDGDRRAADMRAICDHIGLPLPALHHYSQGSKDAFQPAWFLAKDPKTGAAVLAVRGTLTPSDVLTDAAAESVPFGNGYVHRGFLTAAAELRKAIREPLQKLFEQEALDKLVICGHSMGAACALILAIMLSREVEAGALPLLKGVELKCLTYGCPPVVSAPLEGVGGLQILNAMYRFDWVPRVQLANVLSLVQAVGKVEALELSYKQKVRYVLDWKRGQDAGLDFDKLYLPIPTANDSSAGTHPLCHVGKCVWIYDACRGLHTRAEMADPVMLSSGPPAFDDPFRAVTDHFPDMYEAALVDACKQLQLQQRAES